MVKILANARIITDGQIFSGLAIAVEGEKILGISPEGTLSGEKADLGGLYIAPGFIDLHCHGGAGYEFIDATPEAIQRACAIHAANGTRVLYPTISATDYDTTYRALEAIENVRDDCALEIPGVHLEGPYLSPEMCGAQDTTYLTDPIPDAYSALIERFGGLIARWTYAPERDEGDFARALAKHGIIASMGHTNAEYEHVKNAYDLGCRLVTHFYSCTSTITRRGGFRHLGVIESAYLLDEMLVEAIGDGCHLPPELMRLIVKLKGAEKTCLVTDAIRYAGMDAANMVGGTERIPYVIEDGVAKLADRSAFAGSIATTQQLLQRTVQAEIPLAETVRMLTETPARAMGLNTKGRIAPGFDAQFTLFDDDLCVKNCCAQTPDRV